MFLTAANRAESSVDGEPKVPAASTIRATIGGKQPEMPMTLPELESDRFVAEEGLRIIVQVPDSCAQRIVDAILVEDALEYGDYDCVTFKTAPGVQQFRSLGSGRNPATERVVEVPCLELSFFLSGDETGAARVLKAIYSSHPYEEPVVFVEPCARTLHVRGMDEDNPNRFWNGDAEDWVPKEHRQMNLINIARRMSSDQTAEGRPPRSTPPP